MEKHGWKCTDSLGKIAKNEVNTVGSKVSWYTSGGIGGKFSVCWSDNENVGRVGLPAGTAVEPYVACLLIAACNVSKYEHNIRIEINLYIIIRKFTECLTEISGQSISLWML